MNIKFYQTRHLEESGYMESGGSRYDVPALFEDDAFGWWMMSLTTKVRILDYGIGKGYFLRELCELLRLHCVGVDMAVGMDLVRSEPNVFDTYKFNFTFDATDEEGTALAIVPPGWFDLITCNHVLEHVFETEKLLRKIYRALACDGICIVSVPNLAYWPNRIAGLWGCQPLGSELGTERITYGFRPQSAITKWEEAKPSGHIRDFTPAGLKDLCEHCGFEVVGWWKQSHGLLAKLSKHAARNMAVILRRSDFFQ